VGAVATPLEIVCTLAVKADPGNVPLAPFPGAVNVTDAWFTGLPFASFTVACSAVANAVFIPVLCPDPAVLVITAGGPAVLVKLKLAGVPAAGVLAVTV
jgi:hypothetical protein